MFRSREQELGEKLHPKVEKLLQPDYMHHASKVTGMLLERSEEFIFKMLHDKEVLKENVNLALHSLSLSQESVEPKLTLPMPSTKHSNDEDIADLLYDRVSSLEPLLAPYITGMILEMDHNIVTELLGDDKMFLQAVQKAKSCFIEIKRTETLKQGDQACSVSSIVSNGPSKMGPPLPQIHAQASALAKAPATDEACHEIENTEDKKKEEEFGLIVFERAETLHKEYAAQISGMILEMDYSSLQKVVSDGNLLDSYISKAYTAILSSNHCSAL